MSFGTIEGHLDAAMGLPPQPALHFCTHEMHRDGSDWSSYFADYMAAYFAARKEPK